MQKDSDAFFNYVMQREQAHPAQVIVLGYSVGSAPAARIARLHAVRSLILVSAFTSVKAVVEDHPVARYLAPLLWIKMSTIDEVRQLNQTGLILVHGGLDTVVLPSHAEKLAEAYQGPTDPVILMDPKATHNTVFFSLRKQLSEALYVQLSA